MDILYNHVGFDDYIDKVFEQALKNTKKPRISAGWGGLVSGASRGAFWVKVAEIRVVAAGG